MAEDNTTPLLHAFNCYKCLPEADPLTVNEVPEVDQSQFQNHGDRKFDVWEGIVNKRVGELLDTGDASPVHLTGWMPTAVALLIGARLGDQLERVTFLQPSPPTARAPPTAWNLARRTEVVPSEMLFSTSQLFRDTSVEGHVIVFATMNSKYSLTVPDIEQLQQAVGHQFSAVVMVIAHPNEGETIRTATPDDVHDAKRDLEVALELISGMYDDLKSVTIVSTLPSVLSVILGGKCVKFNIPEINFMERVGSNYVCAVKI